MFPEKETEELILISVFPEGFSFCFYHWSDLALSLLTGSCLDHNVAQPASQCVLSLGRGDAVDGRCNSQSLSRIVKMELRTVFLSWTMRKKTQPAVILGEFLSEPIDVDIIDK